MSVVDKLSRREASLCGEHDNKSGGQHEQLIDALDRRSVEMVRAHTPAREIHAVRQAIAQIRERKTVICDCCGRRWNVSVIRDISRVYVCPQCERKLDGSGRRHDHR